MTYRILLSGGGTAGSVTPLIAVAQEIRRRRTDVEFRFVGTAAGPERVLVEAADIPFVAIASGKLRRYWSIKNISDLVKVWRGYIQARKIVRDWRPQVAVTAGSFVSVPVIWAAHRADIATLVHQQDVRPGLANRLMAPAADKITTAFQASTSSFDAKKVQWIGNPVRPEIFNGNKQQAKEFFHLDDTVPVLLVLGGGTGSARINSIISDMTSELVQHWNIIHVTGTERSSTTVQHAHYQQYTFLTEQLPHALAIANVVISRVGLGAMSELAALGKPTIFIPMPDTHQEDNARLIANAEAGIVLDQRDTIETTLRQALERLRQHPDEASRLGRNVHQFYTADAVTHFADLTLQLLKS